MLHDFCWHSLGNVELEDLCFLQDVATCRDHFFGFKPTNWVINWKMKSSATSVKLIQRSATKVLKTSSKEADPIAPAWVVNLTMSFSFKLLKKFKSLKNIFFNKNLLEMREKIRWRKGETYDGVQIYGD